MGLAIVILLVIIAWGLWNQKSEPPSQPTQVVPQQDFTREISRLHESIGTLNEQVSQSKLAYSALQESYDMLTKELEAERDKSSTILSQKISQSTRLGQITEHLVPFLNVCPYNPKDMHFFGNPIDFVVMDLYSADPSVVFLEIKTGGAELSKTQKLIKKLVSMGKVRFEEIRIDDKGQHIKTTKNNE
jgi:predicted Holliday junction resolvase-like endonuclease